MSWEIDVAGVVSARATDGSTVSAASSTDETTEREPRISTLALTAPADDESEDRCRQTEVKPQRVTRGVADAAATATVVERNAATAVADREALEVRRAAVL